MHGVYTKCECGFNCIGCVPCVHMKLDVTNMYIVHSSVNVMHQHLHYDPCVNGALRITCMEALLFATHVV